MCTALFRDCETHNERISDSFPKKNVNFLKLGVAGSVGRARDGLVLLSKTGAFEIFASNVLYY